MGVLGEAVIEVERLAADHRGAVSRQRLNEEREAFSHVAEAEVFLDRERLTDGRKRRLDRANPGRVSAGSLEWDRRT